MIRFLAIVLLGVAILTSVSLAESSSTLYRSSTWIKKKAKVTGTYEIIERDGNRFIRLLDDFKTKKGPDLKLVLSPLTADAVTAKTALDGSLIVHELKSYKGAQEYTIPEDADLSKYKSVLIHCQKYTKLWGAARLEKMP